MTWWQIGLILMFLAQLVLCVLKYLTVSGLAKIIESQKTLSESMQSLTDQMTDLEEQVLENKSDTRKVLQYFVNFTKRQVGQKQWFE